MISICQKWLDKTLLDIIDALSNSVSNENNPNSLKSLFITKQDDFLLHRVLETLKRTNYPPFNTHFVKIDKIKNLVLFFAKFARSTPWDTLSPNLHPHGHSGVPPSPSFAGGGDCYRRISRTRSPFRLIVRAARRSRVHFPSQPRFLISSGVAFCIVTGVVRFHRNDSVHFRSALLNGAFITPVLCTKRGNDFAVRGLITGLVNIFTGVTSAQLDAICRSLTSTHPLIRGLLSWGMPKQINCHHDGSKHGGVPANRVITIFVCVLRVYNSKRAKGWGWDLRCLRKKSDSGLQGCFQ